MRISLFHGFLKSVRVEHYTTVAADLLSELISAERAQTEHMQATSPYDFIRIPEQGAVRCAEIQQQLGSWITENPDIVLVVGIGGSLAGVQAVYDAVQATLPAAAPQFWYADTVEPVVTGQLLKRMERALQEQKKIILIVVSKSGTTLETRVNAALYLDLYTQYVSPAAQRVIAITDEGSLLWQHAQRHWLRFAVPAALGGRYSVWSAVGLVPLALLGVDIAQLLWGAHKATERNGTTHAHEEAALLAGTLAAASEARLVVHDTFIAVGRLLGYGAWYRQLLAESLGKCREAGEGVVRVGMLPTVSLISQDLHSVAQLYLAGPRMTVTTFITVAPEPGAAEVRIPENGRVPNELVPNELVPEEARGVSVATLHAALCAGIMGAYAAAELPHIHIDMHNTHAYELGYLMQLQLLMVPVLGTLWSVDPFHQPQVQEYKKRSLEALVRLSRK